ncbi:MAG: VOC family protein [Pyrinomonadaceae bacterium]
MKLEHIGIATRSIQESLEFWRDALGLTRSGLKMSPGRGARGDARAGEPRVELLEATALDSPIAKFVAKRGPGIHHLAFRVDDIRAALVQLKSAACA